MRTFLFFAGTTLGSIALQASIALWPDQLHRLAWMVPWAWALWAVIWVAWLTTHPSFWKPIFAEKHPVSEEPSIRERAHNQVERLQQIGGTNVGAPITQNASPTINVFPPSLVVVPAPSERVPAKHIPPRVECVRTRTIRVTQGGRYSDCLVESVIIDARDHQAVAAYFRNVPAEGTDDHPDIYNVQAQIIYKDSSGNEIQDVPKGVWLGSPGIQTHLKLNETEGLILMILPHAKEELLAPYQGHYKTFAIGQIATIEVCLTSHNSGRNSVLLCKTFKWMDENRQIDAIILPP